MSSFHASNNEEQLDESQLRRLRPPSFLDGAQTHQLSVSSNPETADESKIRKQKDDAKMKRYLIKIFEKLQENNNHSSLTAESPDPLTEHSNSVQEPSSLRKENLTGMTKGKYIGPLTSTMKANHSNNPNQIMSMKAKNHNHTKYENLENYIKEESSEENQIITEDEEDYNINNHTTDGAAIMNRRRKLKKSTNAVMGGDQRFSHIQQSPGNNPKTIYSQSTVMPSQPSFGDHGRNNKFVKMRQQQQENSYNDIVDRSATNRTPLLEHYQNQGSLTRQNNHLYSNTQQSTSVPRPTIASELKLLKETRGSPGIVENYQQSFIQGNSLASFMWNKEGKTGGVEGGSTALDETSNKGSRIRKEYNIHDGTTSIRPLTRNNQRRPVSRQVNAVDNSGMSVSKILVQQQMRNTHFGDGGFGGFQSKFKGDLSLDSERKLSRKRGTKAPAAAVIIQNKEEQSLRESQQKQTIGNNEGMVQGIITGGGNTQVMGGSIIQQLGTQQLNRSITLHQQQKQSAIQTYNEVSTQESSGNHFYQAATFLNKSIESNSS